VLLTREATLARTMIELSDDLVDDFDNLDLLTTMPARCIEVLDIAAAGVMLVDAQGSLQMRSTSDETTRVVGLFELQRHDGPSLDCFGTATPVVRQDLRSCDRLWPHFAPAAVDAGYRSVVAVPMGLRGRTIGALTLLREGPGSLGDDDVATAQAFADMATITILQHRTSVEAKALNAQLSTALSGRTAIDQATGIIAGRQQLPVELAFERLRKYARNGNLRLTDVARDTVSSRIDLSDFIPPTYAPRAAGRRRPSPRGDGS